jgi:DNA-directed RNA polymerase specialized sigma24 family protein
MEHAPDAAALAARAQAGNQQAFAELQAGAQRAVRGTIVMHVGRPTADEKLVVDHALVDDLVQATWVQVWEKLSTYDPEHGTFLHFARFWARIMARRYRDTVVGKGREVAISALLGDRNDGADDSGRDPGQLGRPIASGSGADTTADDPVDADVYNELLTLTFGTASPPHQLIAFGFAKAIDWKPRQIAATLANVPLRTLEARLEQAYIDQSDLADERVRPAFEPLRNRLEQRFEEAVRDPTTLATYPTLHARIVGETTLAEYFTGEPTADITQWWYAVKRRVIAEAQRRSTGPLADFRREQPGANRKTGSASAARRTSR